jgi:chromosome segregation ATPase
LRSSFDRSRVDYNLESARPGRRYDDDNEDDTSTNRKAKFGDAYLSRIGRGGGYTRTTGTDFSNTKATTEDWEEVRLKKQLSELEAKIDKIEAQATSGRSGGRRADSRPALIKRELEQLLDYKRRELRDLETGASSAKSGGVNGAREEIDTVKQQVNGLESHLATREQELEDLRRQVAEEKGR